MMLEVRNLSFSYGNNRSNESKKVLNQLSWMVTKGELVAVVGPNGVGKSTLFKCILQILRTYEGEILLNGTSMRGMREFEISRSLAYIPQTHVPVYGLSVLDVVLMGACRKSSIFANPDGTDAERAMLVLERLGLESFARRNYGELSGGERQLVLIARSLAQGARILIMDEPAAHLDYGNQVRIMEYLWSLSSEGYSIIFSTHNPEHAFLWSSRTLVLYQGHLIADGDPKEALTEGTMERLYGVPVRIFSLENESNGRYQACMPILRLREHKG
ncbi:MAG: ABC transporter ATP-binding protein [Termitinemataceae bacterium]